MPNSSAQCSCREAWIGFVQPSSRKGYLAAVNIPINFCPADKQYMPLIVVLHQRDQHCGWARLSNQEFGGVQFVQRFEGLLLESGLYLADGQAFGVHGWFFWESRSE
jgi:hypothetical protein